MIRALTKERTALFLYVILVLLPAVVFGGLFAHRLWREYRTELASIPESCSDAAERLAVSVGLRLEELLDEEGRRPFFHFQARYHDPGITDDQAALTSSPLHSLPRPEGVLGWYCFDPYQNAEDVLVFRGEDPGIAFDELQGIARRAARRMTQADRWGVESFQLLDGVEGDYDTYSYTLLVMGVNRHPDADEITGTSNTCYDISGQAPRVVDPVTQQERQGEARMARPTLRIEYPDGGPESGPGSELRLIADRLVYVPAIQSPDLPECLEHLAESLVERQAVVLDPAWLFGQLIDEAAKQVLSPSQRLVPATEAASLGQSGSSVCSYNLFKVLPIEVLAVGGVQPDGLDIGLIHVATDQGALEENFRAQLGWLLGLAGVLATSTAIGLRLLFGRLRASKEEALRTRNFVASVTHELRTPIAAVKLYGEMLADGWVEDEQRRQEYLQRIVRETDRLSGLVDRVLLRRKLQDQPPEANLGDLNLEILAQRGELEMAGGEFLGDLAFELEEGLPPVQLVPDGIHVVLANLVENARKYAPVAQPSEGDEGTEPTEGTGNAEPILIRTRRDRRGSVCLEVLDRGPGVEESERSRIFDAFYRSGDEATRRTTGTGLGLHLVALQARAMRAKVEVLPRRGGGSRFKLTMRRR